MKKAMKFAAVCCGLSFAGQAHAAPILDQLNNPPINVVFQARDIDYWGQSFTVGMAGQLSSILVDVGTLNVPPVIVNFYLAPIINGVALFSQSTQLDILSSDIVGKGINKGPVFADWLNLDFSPFDIRVDVGDQFALIFHSPITFAETGGPEYKQINWYGGVPGGYLGGTPIQVSTLADRTILVRNDFDAAFATFVTPIPEPVSISIMAVGLAGVVVARRRRKNSEPA